MSLGNNLLNLRKKEGLSQEEVAEKLNVSRQTISKWETDQSQPDFDKIKPICELYHITASELLFDEKSPDKTTEDITINENDTLRRKKKAFFISLSILLYFISVIWIMIAIPVLKIDPIVASAGFLLICAFATFVIVYGCLVYKKSNFISSEKKRKSPIERALYSIVSLLFVCIYLYISFTTMSWHITWIIWLIYSIVIEVIRLIFMLRRGEEHE